MSNDLHPEEAYGPPVWFGCFLLFVAFLGGFVVGTVLIAVLRALG